MSKGIWKPGTHRTIHEKTKYKQKSSFNSPCNKQTTQDANTRAKTTMRKIILIFLSSSNSQVINFRYSTFNYADS